MKLFAALKAYGSQHGDRAAVRMVTVTAPGSEAGLVWDEGHCAHLGQHRHSGLLGCKVAAAPAAAWNDRAPTWWTELHRQARLAAKRSASISPELLARVWEHQKRGVLHLHLVMGHSTGAELAAVEAYVQALAERASRHGFGFVDRKREVKDPTAAAAYLSSYFVAGKKGKLSLRETVQSKQMPPSIVYVAPRLSRLSGITMRSLRLRRYIWRRYGGLLDVLLDRGFTIEDLWGLLGVGCVRLLLTDLEVRGP